jgi:hypothetical protein
MKKLSIYLFLVLFSFSAPSFADDISDFQIEGMNIGDSLLEYFSEEKIKNTIRKDYFTSIKDKTFIASSIMDQSFEIYDSMQFIFKRNDKKYKIYGMTGAVFFKDNINDCYNKLIEISDSVSKNIEYEQKDDFKDLDMGRGQGKYSGHTFFLKQGIISVHCYDWSKKIENENNWIDNLRINLKTQEVEDFLRKD